MKYSFRNDYSVVAHPLVLEHLLKHSKEQNIGYGLDEHTKNAQKLIKDKIKKDADIYFLAGGTIANVVVISHILKPYQAVIAVNTGHINVHETGAVEGSGHKIITVKGKDGKVYPSDVESVMSLHTDIHMVEPKLVYISQTTEVGTVYSKKELKDLYEVCHKYGLYLFLDGARLASGLNASDMTYEDVAEYTDVFYIGGTKNGAYFGEAIVIINDELKEGFAYHIKNRGALLAKGFVCAMAFEVLMANDLYLEIGKTENNCAMYLKEELAKLGIKYRFDSPTNQIFPIFNKDIISKLEEDYPFEVQEVLDDGTIVIRLVTAFDTTKAICDGFILKVRQILFKK